MDEQQAQPQPEQSNESFTGEEKPSKVKKFIKETLRVIRITKKPDKEEYTSLVKVTGLGISILGALGFVIFLIKQLLF